MARGGLSTTVSPRGRTTAPWRRAAMLTRCPTRAAGSNAPPSGSARSMPTMTPQRRTSATAGCAARGRRAAARASDRSRHVGQDVVGVEASQAGAGDRGGQGVAGEGVAVEELAVGLGGREERLVDGLGGQGGGQGQVAPRQPLGEAQQIRGDADLLHGEQGPRPSEADGYLVGHQQDPQLAGPGGQGAQERRGVHLHAGGPLHQRLEHERREGLRVVLDQGQGAGQGRFLLRPPRGGGGGQGHRVDSSGR